ncbi:hypothetical protein JEY72_24625 [Pseudomonas aeruginosa]|nr:hypothetical protein [Pseudomonas aeruginosa]
MSEVKRYSPSEASCGIMRECDEGEWVDGSDYDALAAEAQALREEVAELRARVVVLPSVDNVMNIVMRYQWNEKTNVTGTTNWAANLGMRVVEEVKRLNGKTVSEGLLRRLLDSDGIDGIFDAQQNYAAHQELRALLDEIDRLKAENEALLLGMRAILNAYDYADQYNKEGVAVEVMEDLRTLFKGATK